MLITYDLDGQTVELRLVETVNIRREPVYSEMKAYLYTLWRFDIRAVVAYDVPGYTANGDRTVTSRSNLRPAVTDVAIRHLLSQPRGRLTYYDELDNVVLQCPRSGDSCDAAWGPVPQAPVIEKVVGLNNFHVRWQVDCHVEEIGNWGGEGAPVLLSHEWRTAHGINEHLHEVRTIEGRAVFEANYLLMNSVSPDDFRRYVAGGHRCPDGWRRTDCHFDLSADGVTYTYRLTDESARIALKARDIVDVECVQGFALSREDPLLGIGAAAQDISEAITKGIESVGSMHDLQPRTMRAAARASAQGLAGLGALISAVITIGTTLVRAVLPQKRWSVFLRVWGREGAHLSDLQNAAYNILFYRLSVAGGLQTFNWNVYDVEETHNPVEPFVEIKATVLQGLLATLFENEVVFQPQVAAPKIQTFRGSMELKAKDAVEPFDFPAFASVPPVPGAGLPPRDNGTRLANLAMLSQVVQADIEAPYPPPANRTARDPGSPHEPDGLRN